MMVYGVALLSGCLLLGMVIGEALGVALRVDANVGGVGIAMLFLVFASNSERFKTLTEGAAGGGITFWSAMYIPIVVAMAARQNVAAAVDGGGSGAAGRRCGGSGEFCAGTYPQQNGQGPCFCRSRRTGSGVMELIETVFVRNNVIVAFAVIGVTIWVSYFFADKLTHGRIHGSAIAIALGLLAAYFGGVTTGGNAGVADVALLGGIGLMGGGMMRDFAIVATAFGVHLSELKKAGIAGVVSIFAGVIVSFVVGAVIAIMFGYTDAADITTIGAGAVTYIVGPVTGEAIGASDAVITLSVAAGLVKSIVVMIGTPLVAKHIGLDNPQSAMVFGGLMGTTSGVAAGLAATDPKLVPYGAMTATFYTGVGCLLGPSILYFIVSAFY